MAQAIRFGTEGDDRILVGNAFLTYLGLGGNDTYVLSDVLGATLLVELAGGGVDTVIYGENVPITLPDFIENVILEAGNVNAAGPVTGNALDNRIVGNENDNTFFASGGNDSMIGGDGDDTYFVDSALDRIEELAGPDAGNDLVNALVSHVLSANVERGVAFADGRIDLTGNAAHNTLSGNDGVNLLSGLDGNDTILAGDGNDTVLGGNGNDELGGEDGNDLVDGGAGDDSVRGGAGNDTVVGGTGNDELRGGLGINSLTGGSGNDTYVVTLAFLGLDTIVEAAGGGFDTLQSDAITVLMANVENLTYTGAGGFTLTGNALNNRILAGGDLARVENDLIEGLAGNDWIDGREGDDTMVGGLGNDAFVVDTLSDIVVEKLNEGIDIVYTAAASTTLSDNVENLTLLEGTVASYGRGNALANVIVGNSGDNTLLGGAGNDRLEAGGGDDDLYGGAGNDTYVFGVLGVGQSRVFENSEVDSGTDTIRIESAVNFFTMPDNVERLVAPRALNVTGNRLGNVIETGSNSDGIDGGRGADTMIGGGGDDYYRVDSGDDVVVELAGGGVDTVETKVSFTLPGNVEVMFLRHDAGAITGTGNGLDNTIGGNAGNNTLTGLGGNDLLIGDRGNDSMLGGAGNDTLQGDAGNDTMLGGTGDDEYRIDSGGDIVTEGANEGLDTIHTTLTLDLRVGTLVNIESAYLVGGSRGLRLDGNAAANTLVGNERANTLNGYGGNDSLYGGDGIDTLAGGAGDDFYTVDGTNVVGTPDTLIELAGEGTADTVVSLGSWVLGEHFENLLLFPNSPGGSNAFGNAANNSLGGSSQANLLDGLGGNDRMTGGNGDDTYVVESVGDVVVELANQGTDLVRLNSQAAAASFVLPVHVENATITFGAPGRITGNGLANAITGNGQNDNLDGREGDDTLNGAGGDDTLAGGLGNDSIIGGAGLDLMTGGAGDDTYVVGTGDGAAGGQTALEDRVIETAGGGTDLVQLSAPGAAYALPDHVENLEIDIALNAGFTLQGNGLANDVRLDSIVGTSTVSVDAGDDTVELGNVGNAASLTLRGGLGEDHLRFTAAGATGAIDINGFETARILTGTQTVFGGASAITGLRELTVVGGGDLTLPGSVATDYVLDGYAGTLTVVVTDAAGGADSVNLRVVDTTGASIGGMAGVERVVIDSTTALGSITNLLTVGPLTATPGQVFVVGGDAPLVLAALADGADVLLSGYTSNAFDFTMDNDAGEDNVTIELDGFVGTLGLDLGSGLDELTLSSGSPGANAPSVVSFTGLFDDDRLVLTGAGSLILNDVAAADVVIQDYTGTLEFIAEAFGAPVNFDATAAGDGTLFLVGTIGNDVFDMGNTLDGSDSIAGQAGTDTLTANITGLVAGTTGRIGVNGVENSTYTVNTGVNVTSLDMDNVVTSALNPVSFTVTGGTALQSVLDVQNASGTWNFSGFSGVLTFSSRSDIGAVVTGTGGADLFTGRDDPDTFSGGAGNDTLSGGLGNDTLTGGGDADVFVLGDQSTFFGNLGAPDIDTITDFGATDTLQLKGDTFDSLFGNLPKDELHLQAPGAFFAAPGATAAAAADDRIIYNTTNGNLYYDADGVGGVASIQIATLTNAPALTAADIVVT